MDARDVFRRAARDKGVATAMIEKWVHLARPQLAFVRDEGPVIGRFGGKPSMPDGAEWPDFMACMATIDLALVPRGSHDLDLPQDGQLIFFAETMDIPEYCNVVYVPAGVPVTERELPDDAILDDVITPFPLCGRPRWSMPQGASDLTVELDDSWEILEPIYDALGDLTDGKYPFAMGGHGAMPFR
ncbi:DUF1963 domain-containing protein [Dactylosporangium sp. CA-233914]|uniref:DUF1963 domain-containing protein n=1 Tax=Dactylosporangium sp. CA-233914 TaxID=3239934 RepID=UPI003D91140B